MKLRTLRPRRHCIPARRACGSDGNDARARSHPRPRWPRPHGDGDGHQRMAAPGDIVAVASWQPGLLDAGRRGHGGRPGGDAAGRRARSRCSRRRTTRSPRCPPAWWTSCCSPRTRTCSTKILTYHVVAGTVMAADVKAGDVPTVEGSTITVAVDGATVTLERLGQGGRHRCRRVERRDPRHRLR